MAEQEKPQEQNQQNAQTQAKPQVDPELEYYFRKYPWLKDLYEAIQKPDTNPKRIRLDQLYDQLEAYYQKKIAEHGDKPTPRSPNFNNPKWRKKWQIFGFLDPVPWFWNIPDDLPPHIKMRRKLMKRLYWKEALATPEELAEYQRILREIWKLEVELHKELPPCCQLADHKGGTIIGYLM